MPIRSREDYRKQQDLEAARKAGLAPAEVDRNGKEINPHIPQYITSEPFYLRGDSDKGVSLEHQRIQKRKPDSKSSASDSAAKKETCENCKGKGHNKKDCTERPRKIGAKWTNRHIAPDDKKIPAAEPADYDAKRDRWDGYDAEAYASNTQRRHEAMLDARKKYLKEEKLKKLDDHDDEAKIDEMKQMDFAKVEKRVRTTGGGSTGSVRNLRIREDRAKYLLNLDLNSAHYDPKTRSMREDPLPDMDPNEKFFAGDNHNRLTGQASELKQLHIHAWEAFEKGHDVHTQAAPTQAELLHRNAKICREKLKGETRESIEAKYGNAAAGEKLPVELLLGQSEREVEYDMAGRIIKGQEAAIPRSKYEVDAAYINNHTAVWGSWWRDHKWGYKCCHQTIRNSYCTGSAGIEAAAAAANFIR